MQVSPKYNSTIQPGLNMDYKTVVFVKIGKTGLEISQLELKNYF
jgi:hypothetical protein